MPRADHPPPVKSNSNHSLTHSHKSRRSRPIRRPRPGQSPSPRDPPPAGPTCHPQPKATTRPLSLLPISRFYFPHSIPFYSSAVAHLTRRRRRRRRPLSYLARRRRRLHPTPLDRGAVPFPGPSPSQLKENPVTVVPLASADEAPRGSPKRVRTLEGGKEVQCTD